MKNVIGILKNYFWQIEKSYVKALLQKTSLDFTKTTTFFHNGKNVVDIAKCKLFLVVFLLIYEWNVDKTTIFLFFGCFVVTCVFIHVQKTRIHWKLKKIGCFLSVSAKGSYFFITTSVMQKNTKSNLQSEIQCGALLQWSHFRFVFCALKWR